MKSNALAALLGSLGVVLAAEPPFGIRPSVPPSVVTLRAAGDRLLPLMQKKLPPGPVDWLASHPEPGQTFKQYLASNPNRPNRERTALYIQPVGDFSPKQQRLVDKTAEAMAIWYGLPVQSLPALETRSIPMHARRIHPTWRVPQILTGYILDSVLVPNRRKDAVATIALASTDLWPGEGWNFVFGQASLTDRVGVWSLARFGDPETEWPVVLRRTIQVAMHETGHMLGILHCTQFECGMNGSNSLPESDRAPLPFCSECETKICWACGLEPLVRTKALRDFFKAEGLEREATEYERRLKALSSK